MIKYIAKQILKKFMETMTQNFTVIGFIIKMCWKNISDNETNVKS